MRCINNTEGVVSESSISEFVYSVIKAATTEQRLNLPESLRKKINTEKRAKAFAKSSTTDQKRRLLSYLDIGFFWTFVNIRGVTPKHYSEILKLFARDNKVGAIREMAQKGLCVTSDKEYFYQLTNMGESSKSDVYKKEIELVNIQKSAAIIRKWKNKMPSLREEENAELFSNEVANLIGVILSSYKSVKHYSGISNEDYLILNYFYQRRGKYIDAQEVEVKMSSDVMKRKIRPIVNRMAKNSYLMPHFDEREKKYSITKSGIQTIQKFRDKIMQLVNFN